MEKVFSGIKVRAVRISIFFLLFLWCAGFSLNSVFPQSEAAIVFYPFLKRIYSPFCHQDHERTIQMSEYFLVCARCSGIYLGAAAAALASIFVFINKGFHLDIRTGFFFVLPMIIDLIFYNLGLYSYSLTAAFSTGIIFGSALIIFILSIIENSFFYNSRGSV